MAQGQRLGQTPGFIQLDVDHVIFARQPGQRRPVMAAFIGADRHRAGHFGQHLIGTGGQRLFHQRHPHPQQMRDKLSVNLGAPALIGVDDDPGARRTGPHRRQPGHVIAGAKLDLQQGPVGMARRRIAHPLRRVERQGKGGDHRPRPRQPRHVPHPFARLFGRQIPQRAIHRIAGGTGGQQALQICARKVIGQARDLCRHRRQRFAVAAIGHAFAPASGIPVADPHRQHPRLGFGSATDGEHLGQSKAFLNHADPHHSPKSAARPQPAHPPAAPRHGGTDQRRAGPCGPPPRPDRRWLRHRP